MVVFRKYCHQYTGHTYRS
uniref:Uncharacterized protein n=1 Tax=Anguilla anguilla TaxID=7936 RepID=A0A0E9V1L3_ANGAN